MHPSLLTAVDATSHVHLVVGIGSAVAGARCARSLEVGARVKVVGSAASSSGSLSGSGSGSRSDPTPAPTPSVSHTLTHPLPTSISRFIDSGKVDWIARDFAESDLTTLGREEVDGVVDAVFVTFRGPGARRISSLCRRLRIPVNVVDAPELCSFTLLSAHRDGPLQIGVTTSGRGCKLASRIRREIAGFLPVGSGDAVERLGRLRRRLREEDADAVAVASTFNDDRQEDAVVKGSHVENNGPADDDNDDESGQSASLNKLVQNDDVEARKTRRIRWLSQMCEYWPLQRLFAISDAEIEELLNAYVAGVGRDAGGDSRPVESTLSSSLHSSQSLSLAKADNLPSGISPSLSTLQPSRTSKYDQLSRPLAACEKDHRGTIILAGSGPGHPSLLTLAAHEAIQKADLILADKLVPAPILELIPRRTKVHIARKFPGNADAAQDELLSLGLEELQAPLQNSGDTTPSARPNRRTVLRLKQGDPFLFGRGAEEVAFFRSHGYDPIVIPGLSSALSAPLFASIPPTHRGVADHVLLCTGTGRRGAMPSPPSFRAGRTVVFLMALHRIKALVESLVEGYGNQQHDINGIAGRHDNERDTEFPLVNGCGEPTLPTVTPSSSGSTTKQPWQPWPLSTPCAVIERASCPDQRVIRTTLAYVCDAIEEQGSRPPGLLVVGSCCAVLASGTTHGENQAEKKRKRKKGEIDKLIAGDGDGDGSEEVCVGADGRVIGKRAKLDTDHDDVERNVDLNVEKWSVEEGYRDLDWVSAASLISR